MLNKYFRISSEIQDTLVFSIQKCKRICIFMKGFH